MTKLEIYERKNKLFEQMSDRQLLDVWEMTSSRNQKEKNWRELVIVRTWISDEIEERHPDEFYAWLDQKCPYDKDLRKFILK